MRAFIHENEPYRIELLGNWPSFLKNILEKAASVTLEAQLKQGECYNPKKVIFDMALENKVMYLKTAILKLKKDMKKLERDNLELQKENVRLKEMLEKLQAKDN